MGITRAILLGLVQGLTEFIPVSSSGHLIILQNLLGIKSNLTLNVFLHFGTLIAVIIAFWPDIKKIISLQKGYKKLAVLLIIGTIPAGLIGFFGEDFFEAIFSSVKVVGFMLIITGLLLWLSDRISGSETVKNMRCSDAIFIGFAQALAIFPGISRSGATIAGGLFKGLNRRLAARYSFLLSIPIITGATLVKSVDLYQAGLNNINNLELLLATLSASISSYFAIKILLSLIKMKKLSFFAYYCWLLALIILLFN